MFKEDNLSALKMVDMVDNTDVKEGRISTPDEKLPCPVSCDFCDWLGDWKNCPVYERRG